MKHRRSLSGAARAQRGRVAVAVCALAAGVAAASCGDAGGDGATGASAAAVRVAAPSVALGSARGIAGDTVTLSGRVRGDVRAVRVLFGEGVRLTDVAEVIVEGSTYRAAFTVPAATPAGAARVCVMAAAAGASAQDLDCAAFTVLPTPPGAIRGVLTGAHSDGPGSAIAGAEVRLLDARGMPVSSTTTDALGQYEFTGLAPGDYQLVPLSGDFALPTTDVRVAAGGVSSPRIAPDFTAVAEVQRVGALAMTQSLATTLLVPTFISRNPAGGATLVDLGAWPSMDGSQYVRFFADVAFTEGTSRRVRFRVLGPDGAELWSITKDAPEPVVADCDPAAGVPCTFRFASYTSDFGEIDPNYNRWPAGDLTLEVTPLVDGVPHGDMRYRVHVTNLEARWARPWVRSDPRTSIVLEPNSSWLEYRFRGAVPRFRSVSLPFDLPIDLGITTLDNRIDLSADLEETFSTLDGRFRAVPSVAALHGEVTLLDQSILDTPRYAYSFDEGTASYSYGPRDVADRTIGPITLYQAGPGIACFNACIFGCEVCLGAKAWVDLTLKGAVLLDSQIAPDLAFAARLTPQVDATIGGHIDVRLVVCSGDANITGTAEVQLPFSVQTADSHGRPESAGFQTPCVSVMAHADAEASCLGAVGFSVSGDLGPYSYPSDCRVAPSTDALIVRRDATPARIPINPHPDLSFGSTGSAVGVFVRDTAASAADPAAPVVAARFFDGTSWRDEQIVTPAPALVSDPVVAVLPSGRAVAAWAQNTQPLGEIMTVNGGRANLLRQEIFYAVRDARGVWSAPRAITADAQVDGSPAIAADPRTDRAVVVWSRQVAATAVVRGDGSTPPPGSGRMHFELGYAVFDGAAFGAVQSVDPRTDVADQDARVQFDPSGAAWATWTRDADGDLTTAADRQIMLARFEGTRVVAREAVTAAPAGSFAPSLAFDPAGAPLIAFVVPAPNADGSVGSGVSNRNRLYIARRASAGAPFTAERIGADVFAEAPVLRVGPARQATVMFRRFGAAGDPRHQHGDLAAAVADLASAARGAPLAWSTDYLSDDDQTNWRTAFAIDPRSGQHLVANVKQAPDGDVLDATQLASGSATLLRVGDATSPAIALSALPYAAAPVLGAGDLALAPARPARGDLARITATVRNLGLRPLPASTVVRFFVEQGGARRMVGEDTTRAPVPFGGSVALGVPYRVEREGAVTVIATLLDPNRASARGGDDGDDGDGDEGDGDETAAREGAPVGSAHRASVLRARAVLGAPAVPTDISASVGAQIAVAWHASDARGVEAYEVYRTTTPGSGYQLVGVTDQTTYVDALAQPGVRYGYVIAARDRTGALSPQSAEVTAVRAAAP